MQLAKSYSARGLKDSKSQPVLLMRGCAVSSCASTGECGLYSKCRRSQRVRRRLPLVRRSNDNQPGARARRMNHLFPIFTALAYALSFGLYVRFLGGGNKLTGRLGTLFLGLGLIAHYFALLERSRGLHTVPYHALYGSMSLFGWLLAVTYLGLELYHRQRSVGAFVLPFILVFFLAAHLAPADRLSLPAAHGAMFAFHVTLSILAYAAFALSFVLSLIFLGEERLLRSRKVGNVVWRLPPLELLERMSQSSVLVGLVSIAI